MQSKLPDINAALVRYRSVAIESFDNDDDDMARMALGNMVALLPDKFKIVIDTDEYNEKIKENTFLVCPNCKKETVSDNVVRYKKRLSNIEQFLKATRNPPPMTYEEKQYDNVWCCGYCKHENRNEDTKLIEEKHSMPYYLGVIPEAPRRNHGDPLSDRLHFKQQFRNWFKIAFSEIESKIGIYRAEYISQNPDSIDNFGDTDK